MSSRLLSSHFTFTSRNFRLSFIIRLSTTNVRSSVCVVHSIKRFFRFVLSRDNHLEYILVICVSLRRSPTIPTREFIAIPSNFEDGGDICVPGNFRALTPVNRMASRCFEQFSSLASRLSIENENVNLIVVRPFIHMLISTIFMVHIANGFKNCPTVCFRVNGLITIPYVYRRSYLPINIFC